MRPLQLFAQLAFWAAAVVGLNVLVARASRNSIPRRMVRAIEHSPRIDDLFLGHSLMAAGFDADAFRSVRPDRKAFAAAIGTTGPVEHDILLRCALRLKPRRVFYGVFDLQLYVPEAGGWEDLVGTRAMSNDLDPATAARFYAPNDPFRAWQIRAVGRIPMLNERLTLWGRVEQWRRWLGGIGLTQAATNRFGRVQDFSLLEASDATAFLKKCQAFVDQDTPIDAPVTDMLDLTRRAGGRMVVVEMPMPARHRRLFYDHPEWANLRRHSAGQLRRRGATYLVASDWVGDEGFSDNMHLNDRGAALFTRRLVADGDAEGPDP